MSGHLGGITFTGKSGQKYYFRAWPLATRFKSGGLVFLVTKRAVNHRGRPTHELLCIGQTVDFGTSRSMSALLQELGTQGANCICVHGALDNDRRLEAVRDLQDSLELNRVQLDA